VDRVAVTTMFEKRTDSRTGAPLPSSTRGCLWILTLLDVMAIAWMLAAGDWFDTTSRLTSVVTLGGHHLVVLWLAVGGFVALAVMATMTGGFAVASRRQMVLVAAAGAVSVVALGGVLSAIALAVGSVMLITLLGRAFVR
jgi:hypothetical protein